MVNFMRKKLFFKILFFSAILLSFGCMSDNEKKLTEIYNKKYTNYYFEGTGSYYLKVTVLNNKIDTTELKSIYNDAILNGANNISTMNERPGIPWIYLNIYTNNGKFISRISKVDSNYYFLKREFSD